jgi:hypothetical protein
MIMRVNTKQFDFLIEIEVFCYFFSPSSIDKTRTVDFLLSKHSRPQSSKQFPVLKIDLLSTSSSAGKRRQEKRLLIEWEANT